MLPIFKWIIVYIFVEWFAVAKDYLKFYFLTGPIGFCDGNIFFSGDFQKVFSLILLPKQIFDYYFGLLSA